MQNCRVWKNLLTKLLIQVVLLTTVAGTSIAQMKTYTVADGLVAPVVPIIFQDSRGTLWFGSDRGGVNRFDSKEQEFVPFTVDAENVAPEALLGTTLRIVEDKWGHIWFLTQLPSEREGRVSQFDGNSIQYIGTGNALLVDRKGDVWVANHDITGARLIKYTTSGVQRPVKSQTFAIADRNIGPSLQNATANADTADWRIEIIFESQEGILWLGGSDGEKGLILSFQPESGAKKAKFTMLSQHLLEGSSLNSHIQYADTIRTIIQDVEGTFWFGGHDFLLEFNGNTIIRRTPALWSYGGRQRRSSRRRTRNRPFDLNQKVSLRNDSKGTIWISQKNNTRYNLKRWDGFDLLPLRTSTLGEPNISQYLRGFFEIEDKSGNFWFSSNRGAYRYDANLIEETSYRVNDGLGSNHIKTIFEAMDGTLWFGHDNGVTVFNPRAAMVNYTTRLAGGIGSVRLIYEDLHERFWFSIPGGVALYDGKELQEHELTVETEEQRQRTFANRRGPRRGRTRRRTEIVKIFEVGAQVWFVNSPVQRLNTMRYTLFRYANGKFDQISLNVETETGPGGEKLHKHLDVLVSKGEHPWIALGGWLFKPDATGLWWLSRKIFTQIPFGRTEKMRHATSAITALHKDTQGRLWWHLENGEVRRYPLSRDDLLSEISSFRRQHRRLARIEPEILPIDSVVPVPGSRDERVKWFFSVATGKLTRWFDTFVADTPVSVQKRVVKGAKDAEITELQGRSGSPPIAIWESPPSQESQQRIIFVFKDNLSTYTLENLQSAPTITNIDIAPVNATLTSTTGVLWLATSRGAVSYDGTSLTTYSTKEDGFLVDDIRDVKEDSLGNIWFATWGGGVIRYDGETFYAMTTKDGLKHNNVSQLHESRTKQIWFATEGGITQYTPKYGGLPFCRLTSIATDDSYIQLPSGIVNLPARPRDIAIDFQGISPLRKPLNYQFKLMGLDTNRWEEIFSKMGGEQHSSERIKGNSVRYPTKRKPGQVKYKALKPGTYTFLIKAYREGSPYTQPPAALNFTIPHPFWTRWRRYLPTFLFVTAVVTLLGRLIVNRRQTMQLRADMQQQEAAEVARMRSELEEARNIQTGLLPVVAPVTEDFDMAGFSMPATQVGGDFYDYLTVANGNPAIAIADAAGKGLRGAMNAVLTNGMLHEVARFKAEADVILSELNAGLAPRLYGPSFIALNLAILDESKKQIHYANAGQPYPILKRGTNKHVADAEKGAILEIESSDLPLGSMKKARYESVTYTLAEGDTLLFFTDGVIEALNTDEEMYGTERLKELIANIPQHLSAEAFIHHIVEDVNNFIDVAEQYDDLTLVVIKCLK